MLMQEAGQELAAVIAFVFQHKKAVSQLSVHSFDVVRLLHVCFHGLRVSHIDRELARVAEFENLQSALYGCLVPPALVLVIDQKYAKIASSYGDRNFLKCFVQ